MLDENPPVDGHAGETVHAAHACHDIEINISKHGDNLTQCSEDEASYFAQSWTHLPTLLPGGQEVHRDAVQGHQQLRQDEVHQEHVEVCPQLQFCLIRINLQIAIKTRERTKQNYLFSAFVIFSHFNR